MTEITIRIAPALYQRLRRRAAQAGTTVPALVSDVVGQAALLLTDPDLTTPPRGVLRKIAGGLDNHQTPEEIAARHGYRIETVQAGIAELERVARLVERYSPS